MLIIFSFFFSSRRRHTRFDCDWSSDVCSSDLNELATLSGPQYRSYWVDIIDSVRAVYHGTVTYAAATDEAINVSFWDKVDEIGINAYPPLTTSLDPSVDQLVAAWKSMPTDNYWAAVMDHMS